MGVNLRIPASAMREFPLRIGLTDPLPMDDTRNREKSSGHPVQAVSGGHTVPLFGIPANRVFPQKPFSKFWKTLALFKANNIPLFSGLLRDYSGCKP
jgi:hypothetical protein